MLRFTEDEYREYILKKEKTNTKKRANKYGAKKIEYDNIVFHSEGEMRRYSELKVLEEKGLIKDLVLQPRFLLQESFVYEGKKYRKIEYVADFQYYDNTINKIVVEDFKGFKTKEYNIKKKMFFYKYKNYNFIESNE